ncbi:hypothetical protein OMW55_07500 [Sphingomonas sp. BN140010]|uniref:Uncharacterized protein n=1 Tax=Sphingomonas arvum TaxID=2992113 RepID=A0ABT3JEY8_9SPHN|nr:hypothetical protein [Sphingomonas sp. BN140010]MCW3797646.1 hypothetical protein [Sphingomonas sp. BN140010]
MQQSASVQARSGAPGKAHPARVAVVATPDGDGWRFAMRQDSQAVDRLDFSKDAAGMRKADWHEIDFMLEDPSGRLAFPRDKWDAIWVARGTETEAPDCPRAASRDHDVYPLWVKDKVLRVCNRNSDRCLLSFALNFVPTGSPDGPIVATLDPIMGNGNGGRA